VGGTVLKFRACHCFATYVAISGKHVTENSSNCGYGAYELGGLRARSNATCRFKATSSGDTAAASPFDWQGTTNLRYPSLPQIPPCHRSMTLRPIKRYCRQDTSLRCLSERPSHFKVYGISNSRSSSQQLVTQFQHLDHAAQGDHSSCASNIRIGDTKVEQTLRHNSACTAAITIRRA
jgi:hypothetical protein